MRYLLETGRVVEFKCKNMINKIGVLVDFVTQESFIIQLVCVKTGKALARERISKKHLELTESVIEFDDSEEIRGDKFLASIEANIKNALEIKRNTEEYKAYLKQENYREMNDFERFLADQETQIIERLLKAKGF
ncbi:hypothetical protein NEOKW01_0211 [Nematocida sp. AWRm80]|nr:hypothetical protein NEOKW01_0211 [Nematocida sp. AWRm80]